MAVMNPEQERIRRLIEDEALRQEVDPLVASSIGYLESGYNPRATSPKGAAGVMQLIPGTAARFGVQDVYNAEANIRGGVAYLKHLQSLFPDNQDFQIAAYQAGEGAVQRAGGITERSDGLSTNRQYVAKVRGVMRQQGQALNAEMAEAFAALSDDPTDDQGPQFIADWDARVNAEMTAAFAALDAQETRLASRTQPPVIHPADVQVTSTGEGTLRDPTAPQAAQPVIPSDPLQGITFVTPQPGALQAGPIDLTRGQPQPFQGAVRSGTDLTTTQPPVNPQARFPGSRTIPPFGSQGVPRGEGLEETGPGRYAADIAQGAVSMLKNTLSFVPAVEQSLGLQGDRLQISLGVEGLSAALATVEQSVRAQPGDTGPGFLDKLAQGIGTSLGSLVPAAAAGRFLQGIAALAPQAARMGAAVSSGVLEGAAEAGGLFEQLAPLVGEDEAARRAMVSFGLNTVLVSATDRLGIFGDAAATLRQTLTSVVTNGLQEGVQYEIEREQLTVPATPENEAVLTRQGWVREGDQLVKPFVVADVAEAVLIGGVIGGIGAQVAAAVEAKPGPAQEAVQADARAVAPEIPNTLVKDAAGRPLRVYHGTTQVFDEFSLTKVRTGDSGDLYGPGIYLTDNPSVAGYYARGEKTPLPQTSLARGVIGRTDETAQAIGVALDEEGVHWQLVGIGNHGPIYDVTRVTPHPSNIRPVYVNIQNPFDMNVAPSAALLTELPELGDSPTMEEAYRALVAQEGSTDQANAWLAAHGYDGITHTEDGTFPGSQPHRVYIAFSPEQVIPAFGIDAALQAQSQAQVDQPPPGLEPSMWQRWQALLGRLLPPGGGGVSLTRGQRGGIGGRLQVTANLPTLTDAEIDTAAQAELRAAAQRKDAALAQARADLAAVEAGDQSTIDRILQARRAIVAEDGSVVYGAGAGLRRFDSPQEAAYQVLSTRITRLEASDPYQAMNAVRRALETQRQQAATRASAPPTGPGVITTSVGTGLAAQLVAQATAADALPYQALQQSGAADVLPRTGKTLHVNFDMIQTPDDVKQVIATVAELYRGEAETQRRGVRPDATVAEDAATSPYQDLDTILGLEPGTALNAEDAYAVRQVWVTAATRLHELAQAASTGDTAAYGQFLKQLVLTANIHVAATGVRGEAGRALRVFGVEMPATDREFLSRLHQAISTQNGLSPADIAYKIARIPTKEQLARFLAQTQRATRADVFTELLYGAMLSNPTTHVVNSIDNAMRAVWSIPERYLAAAISDDVDFQEANAYLYGLYEGMGSAWRYAAQAFRTEQSQFGALGRVEPIRQHALAERYQGTFFGGVTSVLDKVFSGPGRALLAVDEFFKAILFRAELHAQAYRQAKVMEQLEGRDLAERIAYLVEHPGPRVKEAAERYANIQTLAQPLDDKGAPFEALGRVGQHVIEAREDWLPLKLILPFVRTPFNVAREGLVRSPLALLSSNVRASLNAGGADAALMEAKISLGTAMLATVGMLALQGVVTGKSPDEPGLKDTWDRLGIQQYSAKVGSMYLSYNRFDLFGFPLGVMADFLQIARDSSSDRLPAVVGAIMGAIFQNLTSKTYLRGLAETIDAITPGRGETNVQQGQQLATYVRNQATRLVPSGVAAVARMLDPLQHDTRTMLDVLLSRLPLASRSVPARLDLWGRARLNAEPFGPDLLSPVLSRDYDPDAIDEELLRQRVPLRMPERVVYLQGDGNQADPVELPPYHYQRYVELSAGLGLGEGIPTLHKALATFIASPEYGRLSDGPRGGKSTKIQAIVNDYREAARGKLQEDPWIQRLMTYKLVQRQLMQTPEGQQELRNMRLRIGAP